MRKIALVLALLPLLAACQNFTWSGQGGGLSERERALGLQDVDSLSSEYTTQTFWQGLRRRHDGRTNAFGRDLANIQDFIDRHFFNYSTTDPYVNFPTDDGALDHLARFGITTIAR